MRTEENGMIHEIQAVQRCMPDVFPSWSKQPAAYAGDAVSRFKDHTNSKGRKRRPVYDPDSIYSFCSPREGCTPLAGTEIHVGLSPTERPAEGKT